MNKRSILALLLAFMLVFSSFAAYAEEDNGEEIEVEVEVTVEETEEAEENGEATDEENDEAVEEEEEAAFAPVLPQINLLMNLGQNTAYVNGEAVELDVAPYVVEDRTMVPARFVSESLGFEVDWDEEAKAVMVLYGDVVAISMTIGEETATVWGEEVELEVAPYIAEEGDRTMVPLRFVSESLGFEVDWDEETKGITITGEAAEEEATNTIVDIALADENFSILVAALVAADLVEALQADGPFTVFAPTNEAFEALFEELEIEAEDLLAQEGLADVLLYHVVNGAVMAEDLVDESSIATLSGKTIAIDLEDGVKINEAEVVDADIEADNGVIHVINSVLIPEDFELVLAEEEAEEADTEEEVDEDEEEEEEADEDDEVEEEEDEEAVVEEDDEEEEDEEDEE